MQTVNSAWTAEEVDSVRFIAQNLFVSWKRETNLTQRTFTIGVSLIGGNDIIGITPGTEGGAGIYRYFDESDYVMSANWELGFDIPTGGLSVAQAEVELDNTDGRFLPNYMGGISELSTAMLPRRPMIINAGFKVNGVNQTLPQFAGILKRAPEVDLANRQVRLTGADYVDFFSNRYLDHEAMFTGLRTDQVMTNMLTNLGLSTAQYVLDTGLNTINFGMFDKGTTYSDIFHQLAEAENGQFYQDAEGILRFENRNHWTSPPHTTIQKIIYTAEVINAYTPQDPNLINVVEVKSSIRAKQPNQLIWKLSSAISLPGSQDTSFFVDFDDPQLAIDNPNFFLANSAEDGSGSDLTSNISIKLFDKFARSAKIILSNNSATAAYLTDMTIYGRPAKVVRQLYVRNKHDASITVFDPHPITIENDYIQDDTWANSLTELLLSRYDLPDKQQILTIMAKPELEIGDLISWQGRDWRIYNIKSSLSPNGGFIQELLISKSQSVQYFTIGISTIGSTDGIAP